jgi:hypothetical protein
VVLQEQGDVVAPLQAGGPQQVGQPVRPLVELTKVTTSPDVAITTAGRSGCSLATVPGYMSPSWQ